MTQKEKEYKAYLRSRAWRDVRDAAIARDGGRCRCCGRADGDDRCTLVVHHSQYETPEGSPVLYHEMEGDNLSYLVTLCSYCHRGIHSVRSNYRRFAVKEHDGPCQ